MSAFNPTQRPRFLFLLVLTDQDHQAEKCFHQEKETKKQINKASNNSHLHQNFYFGN